LLNRDGINPIRDYGCCVTDSRLLFGKQDSMHSVILSAETQFLKYERVASREKMQKLNFASFFYEIFDLQKNSNTR